MTGVAGDEVVLATVGLVGDDHYVAAFGERGVSISLFFGEELLDGGEHHAAGLNRQLSTQVGTGFGLGGFLS